MKISKVLFVAVLSVVALSVKAQDPGFREPEARRAPVAQAPQAPVSDETNVAASRINSMEVLDDARALQIGDKIFVRVVEDREKGVSVFITDSGDIQAPHLGLVKVAGKTCKQVALSMKRELEKHYFQQATVIVALEQVKPKEPRINTPWGGTSNVQGDYIVIYGQVARQGKYEITPEEELTVSQAILRAGGFSQFADTKEVKLIRYTKSGNKTIKLNLDDVMHKGRLEKDIYMRRNDVLIVAEKLVNF
jgi:polysaccharide biosynthesis/export protein